jgi:hypothetical protein
MGKTTVLCEAIHLDEARIDAEQKTVEVVLIRPGWSENGRYYAPEVLAQAAALFEGVKAYANHSARRGEARSVLDITGDYTGVHPGEAGELRATRGVFGAAGEAIWPLIVRSVETRRPVIGLSINAVGRVRQGTAEGREGLIVEAITAAHSVDDVTDPAAGGGFDTLLAGSDALAADLLAALSYEEFIAARPDYLERIREQMKRVRQDEAVRAAGQERDQLQAALDEARAQAELHRADADRLRAQVALEKLLREAHLHPDWERDLRAQLEQTDPAAWPEIIQREQRKARTAGGRSVPVSGAPRQVADPVRIEAARSGPLDMRTIRTPEELIAEIRRRA